MTEISETFRKMGLFGLGLISLTQEKIEEFSQEMIKKGEISTEEGRRFVKEILSEQKKQMRELEDKIDEKVKETLENSGIAMKNDIASLETKIGNDIASLETKIETLEKIIQGIVKE